jgi:RNA polymerase sigma-70 factor (ECF subfamily)
VFRERGQSTKRDAFAADVMVHLDHLYRMAFHLAKDPTDADDIVQETLLRALAAHDQFTPGTNLKAWLSRILHNFFIDYYRQKKRWVSVDDEQTEFHNWETSPADNPGPESQVLLNELDDQITQVLRKIPEEFRIPILLVDMGDFSYDEVAAILSCPIGTVRSRLSRGRKLIQRPLQSYVGGKPKKAVEK